MTYDIPIMVSEATGVLKSLIAIPSLSRDKEKAADYGRIILVAGYGNRRKVIMSVLSPMFDLNKPNESYIIRNCLQKYKKHISCEIKARFSRLNSSYVEERHPIVQRAYETTGRSNNSHLIFINNPI